VEEKRLPQSRKAAKVAKGRGGRGKNFEPRMDANGREGEPLRGSFLDVGFWILNGGRILNREWTRICAKGREESARSSLTHSKFSIQNSKLK